MDAVADGVLPAEQAGDLVLLVAAWVDPDATDETACREAARDATRRAVDDALAGTPADSVRRIAELRHDAQERLLRRRVMRIVSIETRSYRYPLDPPFRAAWDPSRARHQDATLVLVTSDDGTARVRQRRRPPARPRGARAPAARASTRCAPRPCARSARRSTSTAAGPGRVEFAVLGSRRPGARPSPSGGCWAAATSARSPTPRAASWSSRTSARAARWRCATRGVRALKLRFHHADWRDDVAVVEAVRAAVGDDSSSWSTPTRAGACPATASRAGTSPTAARVRRALEPLGVYWLEEPLRCDDVEGYARCAASPASASPPARWCGSARGARSRRARRRRRAAARRRARGRHRRLPPARRARRPARPQLVAAHVVERLRPGREPARRAARLDVPVRRGAVRPAGLVGRAARLAAAGAGGDRRRRHDRPPAGPGLGVEPDLDALERWRVA